MHIVCTNVNIWLILLLFSLQYGLFVLRLQAIHVVVEQLILMPQNNQFLISNCALVSLENKGPHNTRACLLPCKHTNCIPFTHIAKIHFTK